jgi:hypothetical protein
MILSKAGAKAKKTFIDHHLPDQNIFIVQATGACTLKLFRAAIVAIK